ncbi:hypothetical protein GCM10023165_05170 [Variovorax defluvii]|uniref:Tir chaperone family protein CesT n=1 Tax=Variovorax defluvii TaxID=913761 RepID=A0ABP8GWR1_9BURK
MQTREAAHRRFVEFTRAFYEHCGWEAPIYETNADTPVAFKAHVDDVAFSIGYDPFGGDHCLFVYCVFGVVPPNAEAQSLRELLERNASKMREHATYCIDARTQELACYARKTLDVDIGALKSEMAEVARQAHQWRRHGELIGDSVRQEGADAEGLSAWTRFA